MVPHVRLLDRPRNVEALARGGEGGAVTRPTVCNYCDGKGRMPETGEGRDGFYECGFCENGVPLDTQDWDRSWGRIFEEEQ